MITIHFTIVLDIFVLALSSHNWKNEETQPWERDFFSKLCEVFHLAPLLDRKLTSPDNSGATSYFDFLNIALKRLVWDPKTCVIILSTRFTAYE